MSKPAIGISSKDYRRLSIAAGVYVACVISLSAWNFVQYCDLLRECVEITSYDAMVRNLRIRTIIQGFILLALAVPLIAMSNRAQAKTSMKLARLNDRMQQDMTKLTLQEAELKDAIKDLERFNAVAVGRENRIIELKAEVNALLQQQQEQKRYNQKHTTPMPM